MTDTRFPGDQTPDDILLADEAEGMSVEPVTQWKLFWSRFRRHRLAMISATVLLLIVLSAIFMSSSFFSTRPTFQSRFSHMASAARLCRSRLVGSFPC